MNAMQTLWAIALWKSRLARIYVDWGLMELTYRVKVARCDLGILWCNVRIFWYG
jgi:hypothetical protein